MLLPPLRKGFLAWWGQAKSAKTQLFQVETGVQGIAGEWERSAKVQIVQTGIWEVKWTSLGCIGDKTEIGTRPDPPRGLECPVRGWARRRLPCSARWDTETFPRVGESRTPAPLQGLWS